MDAEDEHRHSGYDVLKDPGIIGVEWDGDSYKQVETIHATRVCWACNEHNYGLKFISFKDQVVECSKCKNLFITSYSLETVVDAISIFNKYA